MYLLRSSFWRSAGLDLSAGHEWLEGFVVDDLGASCLREHEPDDENTFEGVVWLSSEVEDNQPQPLKPGLSASSWRSGLTKGEPVEDDVGK